jgi:hypothetical protein
VADKFVVYVGPTVVAGTPTNVSVVVRNPNNTNENQILTNPGPGTAFLGQATGVTAATGLPFPPGSELKLIKNGTPIWAIAASTTAPPTSLQLSAGVEPT